MGILYPRVKRKGTNVWRTGDVIFTVSEQGINTNDFVTFPVKSFILFDKQLFRLKEGHDDSEVTEGEAEKQRTEESFNSHTIQRIIFRGREINYFCNPGRIFDNQYITEKDEATGENKRGSYNIKIKSDIEELPLGSFYWDKYDCDATLSVSFGWTVRFFSAEPLYANTNLVIQFSKPITTNCMYNIYMAVECILAYCCRRTNIDIESVVLYEDIDKGDPRYYRKGLYQLNKNRNNEENHKKADERMMTADLWRDHFAGLFKEFLDQRILLSNLPESGRKWNSFGPARMIFDFVAFERENINLYGKDEESSELSEVKEHIGSLIQKYLDDKSVKGKRRKYANSILRNVKRYTIKSLGDQISRAIEDCNDAMTPILALFYDNDWDGRKEGAIKNLNDLRNDVAHGHLDVTFTSEDINDLQMLECLLYAMRLKACGLEDSINTIAVAKLMGLRGIC